MKTVEDDEQYIARAATALLGVIDPGSTINAFS